MPLPSLNQRLVRQIVRERFSVAFTDQVSKFISAGCKREDDMWLAWLIASGTIKRWRANDYGRKSLTGTPESLKE